MISFDAHKLSSVVGEVDHAKETGSERETALETTEETENEIEGVIEKEKENDCAIGTETEEREVDTEDNLSLEALIVKDKGRKILYFILCVFTSSNFIFSCLIKVHCVEGLRPSLFQACSIIRTGNTQILQKHTADTLSRYFYWDRTEQSKNVDINLFSIDVRLLIVSLP